MFTIKEPQCKDCKHFRQHYIRSGERFDWAGCGHCVYPRLKHRRPNVLACVYFEAADEGGRTTNSDSRPCNREV